MDKEFSLKDRLTELREKTGFTRNKLHKEMNVSRTCIKDWENGRRTPNIAGIVTYADYFDVSVDYLLGRTNNPKVNDPIESDEDA